MKVKYLRLNTKERKKVKEKYYKSETGRYVKKKLLSALICAILCIVGSIYLIVDAFINDLSIIEKIYGFVILIIGIILLIAHRKIFIKKINEYVVKTK
ncbi:MAG: hypothetical protein E7167_03905 [Firmicutes bacterium]|nr:hypothetical protein [Bacillota bacterium]